MSTWARSLTAGLICVLLVGACKRTDQSASGGGAGGAATSQPSGPEVCKRGQPVAGDVLKIAVIPMGTTHEFWKSIHAGAVKAQNELNGVQIIWKGPIKEDDRKAQIDVMDSFLNVGVAGIALAPLDNTALVKPVRESVKAGIGVVIMDSGLSAQPCTDYASFVATDNYVGGQKGARRLGEVLNGKGKIILMRYQLGAASAMERERGFLDVIRSEFPHIQILSDNQEGGATQETSTAKGENLLNRFPDVDGIFTPNESTTAGMLRALQQSGRAGKIKFVGFDSSEKLIQGMKNGQIHGLVLQNPLNMGYLAVKTLVAYLRGEEVPTRIDTGSEVATPENMNDENIAELLSPPFAKYLDE